jgi:hypothetical protein
LIQPLKDLLGAVFFVSVGMMLDPLEGLADALESDSLYQYFYRFRQGYQLGLRCADYRATAQAARCKLE